MAHKRFHSIGKVLRKYREDTKMSQQRFALKLGVSKTYVGDIERGKEHPSIETLVRFSIYLNANPAEILTSIIEKELENENLECQWLKDYKKRN